MSPFFWLQYPIARLFFGEYEKARVYFETAYSFAAKRRGFGTFQIDNHYARYLLENAMGQNDERKCMNAFREAHQIISRQIRDERKHYPYRVASNYLDFYKLFYSKLRKIDQDYVVSAAKYVLDHLTKLPPRRKENRYVVDCESRLREIVKATLQTA